VGWLAVSGERLGAQDIKTMFVMYLCMIWYVSGSYVLATAIGLPLLCSWSIFFDTCYATQDRIDDERVGIKSTARLFGGYIRGITSAFAAATILCLIVGGLLNGQGPLYFAISCAVVGSLFFSQLFRWDVGNNELSMSIFKVRPVAPVCILVGQTDRLFCPR